ncbi:hypothetical protein E5D57_013301 [Metarhizium anisopliae]|nr:hypothetical protein E5D57_013301 [Metarhizium anisopliae]
MKGFTFLKISFWAFTLAHLGGSIAVWKLAKRTTDPESSDRGIFSYKVRAQGTANYIETADSRRGLPNPMGDIGSGVTKVLSVATEVPAKISSIARDFELDVGTRKVSVHLGGEPKQLWPPDVDVENIPDALLPSDVNKTIRGIIDKLKAAATFNLGSVVGLLISLAILDSAILRGTDLERAGLRVLLVLVSLSK